ncbi:Hypothetical protein CpMEX30_0292 [Corynebacterium pseudotuberculosis]|nr:Hypothetical protein CpPAT10_0272 [Corynebacterium pseudotuberculosis PAT10]AEP69536.1 Hypothetical protein Cp4202_0264 [Corynebacterium pseudotuberculosis 42/02-A]AER68367.1 Hypothetical protein Cp106_0260 [Corynebacterium pseudotuberculosis 1/06-A]AEX38741.1 Hypothetical protein Cp3995_0268 [Corynebacterium pseudotuberculosis 3/99-5]AFF21429.1 Hypothetical protein CpP54B96_0271 [Corynebacterium pseudotuberculosis P54B96]AFH51188.1 Hypothetical protein Cp267_0280 [Corynebacterium pseudotub
MGAFLVSGVSVGIIVTIRVRQQPQPAVAACLMKVTAFEDK